MKDENATNLSKYLHKRIRTSMGITRKCFILDCPKTPIKAHSVSESKHLSRISEKGLVLYMDSENYDIEQKKILGTTGKGKATTFPGFCDEHDKIFESIDTLDYHKNDIKQEYLFAMRACAREFTIRQAVQDHQSKIIEESESKSNNIPKEFRLKKEGLEYMKAYNEGLISGTRELEDLRIPMNINFFKNRFWKIITETLILDKEYPIVASSIFKLESDPKGLLVNDVHNLSVKGEPLFFSVFPQDGKTYCLLSWLKKHDTHYQNLRGLGLSKQKELGIIISNLLTIYVENFAVNPSYWSSLSQETLDKFRKYWGVVSQGDIMPFLVDSNYSLFIQ